MTKITAYYFGSAITAKSIASEPSAGKSTSAVYCHIVPSAVENEGNIESVVFLISKPSTVASSGCSLIA